MTLTLTRKEKPMNKPGFWQSRDQQISISQCSEGCIHLVVGRAIIKMTQEEFFVLAKLTDTANQEIAFPDPASGSVSEVGH